MKIIITIIVIGMIWGIRKLENKKEKEWTLEEKLFVTGMDKTNSKHKYDF